MPVANPDGYQYTFDTERLWRKNLRDNDADGQITNADGVDLNRNYDINWRYDDEGSSSAGRERDLPRSGGGLRARDEGAPGADRPAEVQVPPHLPLVRPAAALPVRVAGPDAGGRRPALRRVHRHRRQPGRAGLRPGRRSRPLHDQRHDGRLLVLEDRRAQLDAGAERGMRGMRLRLPRRRGPDPGGVREEPAVRPRPGALGAQSVAPGSHLGTS